MTETPALGDLIRESRLALGYSLGQLATKVGRTAATVRSWERGEAVPNEENRAALELVLDINPGGLESLLPPAQPEPAAAGDDADETSGSAEAFDEEATDLAAPELEPSEDNDVDDGDVEDAEEDGSETAAAAGGLASAVAAEGSELLDGESPETSLEDAESDEQAEPEVSEDDEAAEEPEGDGSETSPPVVPLVTEGVPLDDEGVSIDGDDDADDTLEGVAAVTPFEVDPALVDEPTEAVVVPVVAAASGVATQTRSVVTVSEPKEQRSRNPLRVFFDPQNRWLYWVRALLTIVVAVALVFVLVWAAGELFDALGQVLDSIEPTEVDDEGIDALGRLRTPT